MKKKTMEKMKKVTRKLRELRRRFRSLKQENLRLRARLHDKIEDES